MAKVGAKKKNPLDKKVQVAFYTEKAKVVSLGGMDKVREKLIKHMDDLIKK